jgi:uracil-DNA glycosylase
VVAKELEIIKPKVMVLLGAKATESLAQVIDKKWVFAKMLKSQEENITIGDIVLKVFFLPQPTAPYKEADEPDRKQKQIYQEVFHQVQEKMNF